MKYKFMKYGGVALILWAAMECMNENSLVPLIAPLIGAVYAVIWMVIVEMYKTGGKKNE